MPRLLCNADEKDPMSWIVEVSPPWNIATGETGADEWVPVIADGAPYSATRETEAEAVALKVAVEFAVLCNVSPSCGGDRALRVRSLGDV